MYLKLLPVALLLLAACRQSPPDRARADALHMLRHELGSATKVDSASLKVYPFSQEQVVYYTSDVPTFSDGHLVTYLRPGGRAAVYVADNDSAFFFLPARHGQEFTRQYGVPLPASAQ